MSGVLNVSADGSARLVGEVEFDEVSAIKAEGTRLCESSEGPVVFDLSGITQANSVTVALLLEWTRAGARSGSDVSFAAVSSDLAKIIRFSGLDGLIQIG